LLIYYGASLISRKSDVHACIGRMLEGFSGYQILIPQDQICLKIDLYVNNFLFTISFDFNNERSLWSPALAVCLFYF